MHQTPNPSIVSRTRYTTKLDTWYERKSLAIVDEKSNQMWCKCHLGLGVTNCKVYLSSTCLVYAQIITVYLRSAMLLGSTVMLCQVHFTMERTSDDWLCEMAMRPVDDGARDLRVPTMHSSHPRSLGTLTRQMSRPGISPSSSCCSVHVSNIHTNMVHAEACTYSTDITK